MGSRGDSNGPAPGCGAGIDSQSREIGVARLRRVEEARENFCAGIAEQRRHSLRKPDGHDEERYAPLAPLVDPLVEVEDQLSLFSAISAIPLDELRYWSVARQEAYADAAASLEAERRAGTI